MTSIPQTLSNAGFVNVQDMISAAARANLPLWIAAAFVEMESKGRNIYGHDAGGTFAGHGAVTRENYAEFYNEVVNHHQRSNGVGPMQITWPGFLTDAARRGIALWLPSANFEYGFRLIVSYLNGNYSSASIQNAGRRYNGSAAYGQRVAALAGRWHGVLVPAVKPSRGPERVLRRGSTGADVKRLQAALNRVFPAYSHLSIDGVFGRLTERVIVEAQSRFGIQADGVVGPVTRAKLASVGATF